MPGEADQAADTTSPGKVSPTAATPTMIRMRLLIPRASIPTSLRATRFAADDRWGHLLWTDPFRSARCSLGVSSASGNRMPGQGV